MQASHGLGSCRAALALSALVLVAPGTAAAAIATAEARPGLTYEVLELNITLPENGRVAATW